MHIKDIAIECTGMCKSDLGSQRQVLGDQKSLSAKINAYSWKAQWTSHSGEIPHSRTVAWDVESQHGVGEKDSHPQCSICSQPKNRVTLTPSVHLAPTTRLNSSPN